MNSTFRSTHPTKVRRLALVAALGLAGAGVGAASAATPDARPDDSQATASRAGSLPQERAVYWRDSGRLAIITMGSGGCPPKVTFRQRVSSTRIYAVTKQYDMICTADLRPARTVVKAPKRMKWRQGVTVRIDYGRGGTTVRARVR